MAISIRCSAEALSETLARLGLCARVEHQQVGVLAGDRRHLGAERRGQRLSGLACTALTVADGDDAADRG